MAEEKKRPDVESSSDSARLEKTAFQLFQNARQNNNSPKQVAIRCFRDAAAFLETADQIMNGSIDIVAIDNNPLDEAYAPNLKKTHPCNMISRELGSVKLVQETYEMIKSPGVQSYEKYDWNLDECNKARALFPAVLERAGILKPAASVN